MADSKNNLPDMFKQYPALKNTIVSFCDYNIGPINIDVVHGYINKYINIIIHHDALSTGGER
eukprot:2537445-Ditylum_brightwellii.AAC.1